jgi:predicted Zn-dependent protease
MRYIFLVVLTVILSGCLGKTPVTDRSQMVFISTKDEMALGDKSYKEFLSTAKISTNKTQTKRVKEIGKRIAKATGRSDYKWEFNLVEDKQINAFCLPGGKVVVFTGILKLAKNDDQLATVMSHEVAHALARHGAERMAHQQISNSVQALGSVLIGATAPEYSDAFNLTYGYGTQLGIMLPYSRRHETEADEIGVHLMNEAGYDITQAVEFWKNMKKAKSGASQPEFLSTHPNDDSRIKNISRVVAEIRK